MKKFILIIIASALLILEIPVKAEPVTVTITPDVSVGELAGSGAGNKPSFETKFTLNSIDSTLPTNAIIQTAKVRYTQVGISGGLLRIIDKYSADIVDSKSMAASGIYEVPSILTYVRKWFSLPSQNLGLLFQASTLSESDSVTIGNLELIIEYSLPDLTPPSFDGEIKTEVGTSTVKISFNTNEPTLVNIDYGRTSNYGQEFITDNVEPSIGHFVLLESLTNGSTYHYKVTITDSSNNPTSTLDLTFETLSDFDNTGTKQVDQSLKAPQEFTVETVYTYGKPQASLSWNPSNETNIQGYIIYRADDITKKFTEYKTLDVKTNTYLDLDVSLGETYYYYVRSYSDLVISPKSDEKSITFPLTVPNQKTEQPPTLQTFLIILAAASTIIFIFYLIIKTIQRAEDKRAKRLHNVLKDPEHYLERS